MITSTTTRLTCRDAITGRCCCRSSLAFVELSPRPLFCRGISSVTPLFLNQHGTDERHCGCVRRGCGKKRSPGPRSALAHAMAFVGSMLVQEEWSNAADAA